MASTSSTCTSNCISRSESKRVYVLSNVETNKPLSHSPLDMLIFFFYKRFYVNIKLTVLSLCMVSDMTCKGCLPQLSVSAANKETCVVKDNSSITSNQIKVMFRVQRTSCILHGYCSYKEKVKHSGCRLDKFL